MPFKIIVAEIVNEDVDQALKYYETISKKLSQRFENELLAAFAKLKNFPTHYFNLQKGFRRITLKSFPYMIIYKINKEDIFILAVFHQHKNQEELKSRKL